MADDPGSASSGDAGASLSEPTGQGSGGDADSAGTGGTRRWWSTRAELRSFAELLGLTSIAVAQHVLAVFGNDASSFVAVGAGTFDIVTFAIIVVLAPPIVLWAAERLVGFIGPSLRRWLHLGFVAVLVGLFVSRLFPPPIGVVGVLVVVLAAAGAVVAVVRTAAAGQFLRYLAFSPLLFLALFIGFSPVASLIFTDQPQAIGRFDTDDLAPVVMVVLDELPLNSLLDGEGNVDTDAYPNIAALAEDATFARNHTTLSPTTPIAVPTILTGLVPDDPDALATAGAHPRNLFTLLGDTYATRASEHITRMCPPGICEVPDNEPANPVYLLLRQVPDVFTKSKVFFNIGFEDTNPAEGFEWLTESVGYQNDDPTLNYLHTPLPHQPWKRLPGGETYPAPNPPVRASDPDADIAPAQLGRQRHLLQLAYADQLVGRLLDDLREAGVYDESLIVVTADHGVSFRPGEPLRPVSEGNITDIAWTPLFVKAPHQREPQVIDSPTASIDVLPTIIDVLGLDVDWEFDGQSIFAEPRPDDWGRRMLRWQFNEIEPAEDGFVHFDGPAGYSEVIESRALDYGPEWDLRFYRWGEYGDLVGREVDSFEIRDSGDVTATLDHPDRFADVDLQATSVPAYVSGRLSGDVTAPVAVAVNGVIGATYDLSAAPHGPEATAFQAVVPPSLLHDGNNDIEVFLIEGGSDERTLVRTGAANP